MTNSMPTSEHSREELTAQMDAFLDALAARDASAVPWAEHVVFTENNVQLAVGDGVWNTCTAIPRDYDLKAADPSTGQVSWFGHIVEGPDTAVMCLRLRVSDGGVAEAEAIICRPHEFGPFPVIDLDRRPRESLLADVPESRRVGRERMIALANGYFDTLQLNDNLWTGTLTASQVVANFASVSGGDALFDFGGGDVLVVAGVTDVRSLIDDILIV